MKKFLVLAVFLCLGSLAFAQMGMDVSLGFQYGTARITEDGVTRREITEPGVLATFRMAPNNIGFFGRMGLLFPTKVTEGNLTLTYRNLDYILFMNMAFGASFKAPLTSQLTFVFDGGISLNDMMYGGSYRDTIDASWKIKIENMGSPIEMSGGEKFTNVRMKDSYNDFGIGVFGNAAMRFNFTQSFYLELGAAASFDFLRLRTYKFSADFSQSKKSNGLDFNPGDLNAVFPADKIDSSGTSITLGKTNDWNVFKQITFIPSISVGYSF